MLDALHLFWLHTIRFLGETGRRITSQVPGYWRRVQVLAGSVSAMAEVLLQFESHLSPEIVPWAHRFFTYGLVIAGTAQLACANNGAPSPTAALQKRLKDIAGEESTTTLPLEAGPSSTPET